MFDRILVGRCQDVSMRQIGNGYQLALMQNDIAKIYTIEEDLSCCYSGEAVYCTQLILFNQARMQVSGNQYEYQEGA